MVTGPVCHGASQGVSRSGPRTVFSGPDDPASPVERSRDPERGLRRRPPIHIARVHRAGLERGRVAADVDDPGHLQEGEAVIHTQKEGVLMDRDALKNMAADAAVEYVKDGQIVGLGTGSTLRYVVGKLGGRIKKGLRIRGVAPS